MTDTPESPRCSAWVYSASGWDPPHQCARSGVEEIGGHLWCRQHATQGRRIGVGAASLGRAQEATR